MRSPYIYLRYVHTIDKRSWHQRPRRSEAIGIGAVMAEVAWLSHRPDGLPKEMEVIHWLTCRYDISEEDALRAIKMAERSGVIERSSVIRLKGRDESLVR
jgi:hypothetical protein